MKHAITFLIIMIWSTSVFSSRIEVSSIPSSQDTTFGVNWDADTILVMGNLMIGSNMHCDIAIKTGAVVYFTGPYGINIYSYTSSFNAVGTKDDSIVFTSPDSIRWNGIRFSFVGAYNKKVRNINFSYCKVERCTTRVLLFEGFDTLSQLTLTHNSFKDNKSATPCVTITPGGTNVPLFKTLISNNLFVNNEGGAVKITNYNHKNDSIATILIENNLFSGNNAAIGGAITISGEKVLIRNNRFENNQAKRAGGAIYVEVSSSIIERNVFVRNSVDFSSSNLPGTTGGGALYLMNGAQERDFSAPCVVSNNLFAFNQSPNGGAIHCNDARTILINNTICNNLSTNGGGIYFETIMSYVRLYNTIIWGNKLKTGVDNQCYIYNAKPDFYNCVLDGGTAAIVINDTVVGAKIYPGKYTNCLDVFPEFVDSLSGNFRLVQRSPCINKGITDTSGLNIGTVDLDSNPRIQSTIIDIGCYEVMPVASVVNLCPKPKTQHQLVIPNRMVIIKKPGLERNPSGYFNLMGCHSASGAINGMSTGVYIKMNAAVNTRNRAP
ncbi:MAG TPA: hypothetical protein VHO70_13665 [Chitinispirillaceae bacterium]|nr:hypothetical protein [Chitinispirillaceae bacterium]